MKPRDDTAVISTQGIAIAWYIFSYAYSMYMCDKIKIFNIYELSILIQNKMGSRNILVKYFSILFCVCKTKTAFVSFLNIFGRGEV